MKKPFAGFAGLLVYGIHFFRSLDSEGTGGKIELTSEKNSQGEKTAESWGQFGDKHRRNIPNDPECHNKLIIIEPH